MSRKPNHKVNLTQPRPHPSNKIDGMCCWIFSDIVTETAQIGNTMDGFRNGNQ